MLVLGLQGSPRLRGNTSFLLSSFMNEAERLGAKTHVVEVDKKHIVPCKEYGTCEKKGFCPINDDMETEIYPLLRRADVILVSTPIFFYSTTAQLKALIDRSQTLWARKYKLKLTDPKRNLRRGFFLAAGATKGKNLFEGVSLTIKYFFDAVGASFDGSLTYRQIENPGDMKSHPTVMEDVRSKAEQLILPLVNRKKILFACRENACRSQMACAFAQKIAGDKIEALSAGSEPALKVSPQMVEAMQEKGIDMAFSATRSLDNAITEAAPAIIVTMGCKENCPYVPGVKLIDWDLPDPSGKSLEFMRNIRDEIEKRVIDLINEQ
jgi:multimeric flavodoxin WrbA/protein-tyrosine-phosphatase